MISLKLDNQARRWRMVSHFQIFLTFITLFTIFFTFTFCACCSKNQKPLRVALKTVVLTKTIYMFHVEVTLCRKIMWITNKYLAATKTIMWQPKEGLMLTKCGCCCKEKGFLLTKSSSYMLYWLKKFCVKRKKLWCRTRIKVGVHKCY